MAFVPCSLRSSSPIDAVRSRTSGVRYFPKLLCRPGEKPQKLKSAGSGFPSARLTSNRMTCGLIRSDSSRRLPSERRA